MDTYSGLLLTTYFRFTHRSISIHIAILIYISIRYLYSENFKQIAMLRRKVWKGSFVGIHSLLADWVQFKQTKPSAVSVFILIGTILWIALVFRIREEGRANRKLLHIRIGAAFLFLHPLDPTERVSLLPSYIFIYTTAKDREKEKRASKANV